MQPQLRIYDPQRKPEPCKNPPHLDCMCGVLLLFLAAVGALYLTCVVCRAVLNLVG